MQSSREQRERGSQALSYDVAVSDLSEPGRTTRIIVMHLARIAGYSDNNEQRKYVLSDDVGQQQQKPENGQRDTAISLRVTEDLRIEREIAVWRQRRIRILGFFDPATASKDEPC